MELIFKLVGLGVGEQVDRLSCGGVTVVVRVTLSVQATGLPATIYRQLGMTIIFGLARCIYKNWGFRGLLKRNSEVAGE